MFKSSYEVFKMQHDVFKMQHDVFNVHLDVNMKLRCIKKYYDVFKIQYAVFIYVYNVTFGPSYICLELNTRLLLGTIHKVRTHFPSRT